MNNKNIKYGFWGIIIFLWGLAYYQSFLEGVFQWKTAMHSTGELAWRLLIFTIFISLLFKLFPKIKIFGKLVFLKKHAGIFAFLIALSHALTFFLQIGILGDFKAIMEIVLSTEVGITLGTISFLIMLPIFITSTEFFIKKMGYKSWKNLQRMTHLAFIFAALHITLLPFFRGEELNFMPFVVLGIYALGYLRIFVKKNEKENYFNQPSS